jgi:hypothetical protein
MSGALNFGVQDPDRMEFSVMTPPSFNSASILVVENASVALAKLLLPLGFVTPFVRLA